MCQIRDAVKETSFIGLKLLGGRCELIQSQQEEDFEKQLAITNDELENENSQRNCDHSTVLGPQIATASNNPSDSRVFEISCTFENNDCNTCKVTFVDALAHQTVVFSDVDRYNISLPVIDVISGGNPYNRHKLDE
jgi:hypothetical protein